MTPPSLFFLSTEVLAKVDSILYLSDLYARLCCCNQTLILWTRYWLSVMLNAAVSTRPLKIMRTLAGGRDTIGRRNHVELDLPHPHLCLKLVGQAPYRLVRPVNDSSTNLQLYFYETDNELTNRLSVSDKLRPNIVSILIDLLDCNPYAKFFRYLRDVPCLDEFKVFLRCDPSFDQRTYNLPTVEQVAAIWKDSDISSTTCDRHVQVFTHSGAPQLVNYYYGCYDPLQYPLLFPYGQPGWHVGIPRVGAHTVSSRKRSRLIDQSGPLPAHSATDLLQAEAEVLASLHRRSECVSVREYYRYRLQVRVTDDSILLHGGRLFQQWVIDQYIKVESQRLDYFRHEQRQKQYRTETLQGIVDSVSVDGVTDASKVGQPTILPTSFIGGPRDMRKRYLDAMTLVQTYGKPDFFLTMTCNPAWPEIGMYMREHEDSQNRPDLVARAFRARVEELKHELIKNSLLGEVVAYTYVIEFQKRGLPHTHWLLIMKEQNKIKSLEAYDRFISAELPDSFVDPYLYSLVCKHMIHGPCGKLNPNNVCMRDGKCKNQYPKQFCEHTTHTPNAYPQYRRRDTGHSILVRKHTLDNRWVVPYCPYLLAKFDSRINVEICSDIKLVKYLYKYICKGHDKVSYSVGMDQTTAPIDEIKSFQTGRWVAPPEACWRLFGFSLSEIHPPVVVLQLHLPNYQYTSFKTSDSLTSVIANPRASKTMLTEFFRMNATDERAKKLNLLYSEYPQYFVWNTQTREWSYRKRGFAIGRIVSASPSEGERYFERMLLQVVRCPDSFGYLKRTTTVEHATFRDGALSLGLLDSDVYLETTLAEAATYQMPHSMRRLFATILVYCCPSNPTALWEKYKQSLTEDLRNGVQFYDDVENYGLKLINDFLIGLGRSITDFNILPEILSQLDLHSSSFELQYERNIEVLQQDLVARSKLNPSQRHAFDVITTSVYQATSCCFFVDGPAGTGKTFLYRVVLADVRSHGRVAIAVATSGVAASLLPGGRTAHSRFKIPIDLDTKHSCKVSKQGGLAKLLTEADLILWDEISMARTVMIHALDDMLRDVTDCSSLFGGKVVVFGGDFRQIAPVIPNGQKEDMISASFVSSPLFKSFICLSLTENMRSNRDPNFVSFLQTIGDGSRPYVERDKIAIPEKLIFPYIEKDTSLNLFLDTVFPNLNLLLTDPFSYENRSILSPTNDAVDMINEIIINKLPGTLKEYFSTDKTKDPDNQGKYEDFLHVISTSGLPPHVLKLKLGCPIMLLRNLNPVEGLCNGTRLYCKGLQERVIHAEILTGPFKGKETFIPRIPLECTDLSKSPIPFIRTQFPVKLCFSLTINKSQGQTLDFVGLYLREPVFSHGQLHQHWTFKSTQLFERDRSSSYAERIHELISVSRELATRDISSQQANGSENYHSEANYIEFDNGKYKGDCNTDKKIVSHLNSILDKSIFLESKDNFYASSFILCSVGPMMDSSWGWIYISLTIAGTK